MKAPKITETQEHLVVVAHINKFEFVDDVIWTHIRGERSSAADGKRAKKMGVKPSLPDFMFIGMDGRGWIEMKERGWRARRDKTGAYTVHEIKQLKMHTRLRARGDWVEVCETLEEVIETLCRRGIPLRSESPSSERIRRGVANALREEKK